MKPKQGQIAGWSQAAFSFPSPLKSISLTNKRRLPGEEAEAVTAGKALTQECIPLISRQITHRERERETETQDSL